MPGRNRMQYVEDTRSFMDAEGSSRWSDTIIMTVLDQVFDAEWSNILNAAPYYTFGRRSVSLDANGRFQLTALNAGGGDTAENFYRIITIARDDALFQETRYQDLPLAAQLGSPVPWAVGNQYYIIGREVQLLPIGGANPATVAVNWKPPVLSSLSSDVVQVDFPDNNHLLVCWVAAAQLLLKGGAESSAAADLMSLANTERQGMLDDLRRVTINPTRMAYSDTPGIWAGL